MIGLNFIVFEVDQPVESSPDTPNVELGFNVSTVLIEPLSDFKPKIFLFPATFAKALAIWLHTAEALAASAYRLNSSSSTIVV